MPGSSNLHQVDTKALGKAVGLFWSAAVVFIGISSRFGWGNRWETLLEDLFPVTTVGLLDLLPAQSGLFVTDSSMRT